MFFLRLRKNLSIIYFVIIHKSLSYFLRRSHGLCRFNISPSFFFCLRAKIWLILIGQCCLVIFSFVMSNLLLVPLKNIIYEIYLSLYSRNFISSFLKAFIFSMFCIQGGFCKLMEVCILLISFSTNFLNSCF